MAGPMHRWALLSPDGRYRWMLGRTWDPTAPVLAVVGLNPSTADGRQDDPTIRRVMGFARSWGFGGVRVVNLYARRTPYPKALFADRDPVGPGADRWIARAVDQADLALAAWGNDGLGERADLWRDRVPWYVLGLTKRGAPRHPLYVRATTRPVRWMQEDACEE